jgi:dihydroorotase
MTGDLLIQKARIVDPSQEIDWVGDILIEAGKIKQLDKEIPFRKENIKNVINAENLVLTAGWVDIHTHLREPGFTHKETIQSGGAAAAAGGFTSIACMANTNPVNDNALITQYIVQKAKAESVVNVFPIGSISKNLEGKELSQMALMKRAGIVAISDDGKTVMDAALMRKAMEYAKDLDLTVITHSEDSCLKGCGVMNEGLLSTQLGLKGIPKISEDIIAIRLLRWMVKFGKRIARPNFFKIFV